MNHFGPHAGAAFEGYYSKFNLPSGANLVVIICAVFQASERQFIISITYVPSRKDDGNRTAAEDSFQEESFFDVIRMNQQGKNDGSFQLSVPGAGFLYCDKDGNVEYFLQTEKVRFKGKSWRQTPWLKNENTPAGLFTYLPLPLQWHVHSRASLCNFELSFPGLEAKEDMKGTATVHQEKNWGQSFPKSHIWMQAWNEKEQKGFACAGGSILGMNAFLLGYSSSNLHVGFKPPFSLQVLGLSPFMSVDVDWRNRTVSISTQDLFGKKMVMTARAEKGSFVGISAPFADGHRPNFLAESFEAVIDIKVYERPWWSIFGAWKEIASERFERAALEFGGDAYPLRGSDKKNN